jgi:hypothetical protein
MSRIETSDMQSRDEYLARQYMVLPVSANMLLPDIDLVFPSRADPTVSQNSPPPAASGRRADVADEWLRSSREAEPFIEARNLL